MTHKSVSRLQTGLHFGKYEGIKTVQLGQQFDKVGDNWRLANTALPLSNFVCYFHCTCGIPRQILPQAKPCHGNKLTGRITRVILLSKFIEHVAETPLMRLEIYLCAISSYTT